MIFPAPVPRAKIYSALLFACVFGITTGIFPARDELPRGTWVERQSGLILEIKPKNTIVLFGSNNSTEFEVVFTPEIFVRDEYWMSIKSIQEKPHEIKISEKEAREKKQPVDQKPVDKKTEKPGEKSEPAPAEPPPKTPEPLRLDWLAPDHKMILSFLMQEPEPAQSPDKKKTATADAAKTTGGEKQTTAGDSVAPGTRGSQPAATKPLPPVPVLEVLIFKQGLLIRELIFDRAP